MTVRASEGATQRDSSQPEFLSRASRWSPNSCLLTEVNPQTQGGPCHLTKAGRTLQGRRSHRGLGHAFQPSCPLLGPLRPPLPAPRALGPCPPLIPSLTGQILQLLGEKAHSDFVTLNTLCRTSQWLPGPSRAGGETSGRLEQPHAEGALVGLGFTLLRWLPFVRRGTQGIDLRASCRSYHHQRAQLGLWTCFPSL